MTRRYRGSRKSDEERHVWIVNHYASRPGEPAIRHYALARELQSRGWSTSIVACSTQHSTGRQRLSGVRLQGTEDIDNVTYRWLRMPTYGNSSLLRLLNMVGFAVYLLLPFATRGLSRPDIVLGSTVHPLAAWAASRVARRRGVPFVFEIRDLWPETLVELGSLSRTGVIAKSLYCLEKRLCNRAAVVVTTMPFAVDYLKSRGVDPRKVVWISNGVWVDEFSSSRESPTSTGSDQKNFLFLYFGALGTANNIEVLIRGFKKAKFPDNVKLQIVGAGPARDRLTGLVADLGLERRVLMDGPVPRSAIPALAASADCLVVAMQDSPLYRFGMSLNKLFEYMASGRPILFAGEARGNPLKESRGGVCAAPESESVARGMRLILESLPNERLEMGRRNRALVSERFDYGSLSQVLADVLTRAVKQ